MSAPQTPSGQPARASAAKRFGPLIGIVVVILVIAVVVTVSSRSNGDVASAPPASSIAGGSLPVTFDQAKQAGSVDTTDWGPNCDKTTGKVKLPSTYAAPCVPTFSGRFKSSSRLGPWFRPRTQDKFCSRPH